MPGRARRAARRRGCPPAGRGRARRAPPAAHGPSAMAERAGSQWAAAMPDPDVELSRRLQRVLARAAMAECKAAGLVVIPFPVFADAILTALTSAAGTLELFDDARQV